MCTCTLYPSKVHILFRQLYKEYQNKNVIQNQLIICLILCTNIVCLIVCPNIARTNNIKILSNSQSSYDKYISLGHLFTFFAAGTWLTRSRAHVLNRLVIVC